MRSTTQRPADRSHLAGCTTPSRPPSSCRLSRTAWRKVAGRSANASTSTTLGLAAVEDLDYAAIATIGPRLFAYRQRHEWPPTVVAHDGWRGLCANACEDIVNDTVLAAVGEAVDLVNGIIERAVGSAR